MWGSKCPNCAKKIKKEFNYCPYCGLGFKQKTEQENFGLLGRDDLAEMPMPSLGSLDKLMTPLIKQIMSQMGSDLSGKPPRGFKIQITTNKQNQKNSSHLILDEKEIERRKGLPRKEAESNVRRFSDKIIYEISVPGVKAKEEINISKLESSIEIKAYSKDACYVKNIPVSSDVVGYKIKDGTLFLEFKN